MIQQNIDVILLETFPSVAEAANVCALIEEHFSEFPVMVSLSLSDDASCTGRGEPLEDVVSMLDSRSSVWSLGLNCASPSRIELGLRKLSSLNVSKRISCHPNNGDEWDASSRDWVLHPDQHEQFSEFAGKWVESRLCHVVGGCCRTRPEDIHHLVKRIRNSKVSKAD